MIPKSVTKVFDKLIPDERAVAILEMEAKQKFPQNGGLAIMFTRRLVKETPPNSKNFDEKKFWQKLESEIRNYKPSGEKILTD